MANIEIICLKRTKIFKLMDISIDWQGYDLLPHFPLKLYSCRVLVTKTKLLSIKTLLYTRIDIQPVCDSLSDH